VQIVPLVVMGSSSSGPGWKLDGLTLGSVLTISFGFFVFFIAFAVWLIHQQSKILGSLLAIFGDEAHLARAENAV